MVYRLLADLVVLVHFGFVLFVILGGMLVLRWKSVAWVHLPAAAWGAIVEFMGWICPLTPLEIWLRVMAGQSGYQTGFIAHYLLPVLYPQNLTRDTQIWLGVLVLCLNLAIYGWLIRRWMKAEKEGSLSKE